MPKKKQTTGETQTDVPPVEDQSWSQPALPEDDAAWQESVAHQEEESTWDGSSEMSVKMATEEEWGAVPVPLTLSIERHSGRFNPLVAKIMIFGETGTQKTRTASTFPNVIFADADHGMSSVSEQVDKVTIEDNDRGFKQLQALYEFLAAGDHEYETVVLDTLNEIQRIIMRFTIEEYTHIRRSYGNLPGVSDYGKMLYEFTELVRSFVSLPMRVVLLAQVKAQEFESDVIVPQLIGKNTVRELMRKMDIVGYIHKEEGGEGTIPAISFDSPLYVTKDRSNRLPATLPNPTYARMAAYWK